MVVQLKITGKVQGVGYRYSMFYAAKNYNVTGWVRNCSDGSVDAVVEGNEKDVREFVRWAWKGPSLCEVDNVEITEISGHFDSFEIRPTL
jgi:acylphosphatase